MWERGRGGHRVDRVVPGQSTALRVSLNAPAVPGDYSRESTVSSGKATVVQVVVRSPVPLPGGHGRFSGSITDGDGDGFPAQESTYQFDVLRGAPANQHAMDAARRPGLRRLARVRRSFHSLLPVTLGEPHHAAAQHVTASAGVDGADRNRPPPPGGG